VARPDWFVTIRVACLVCTYEWTGVVTYTTEFKEKHLRVRVTMPEVYECPDCGHDSAPVVERLERGRRG
jgi:hypothetical protein